jgi:hypothetical protein
MEDQAVIIGERLRALREEKTLNGEAEGCLIRGRAWIRLMFQAGHEFVECQADGDLPREARNGP